MFMYNEVKYNLSTVKYPSFYLDIMSQLKRRQNKILETILIKVVCESKYYSFKASTFLIV